MSEFIELYNNYTVNIDSIFSLQAIQRQDSAIVNSWYDKYNNIKEIYLEKLPIIEVDGEQIQPDETDEGIERYGEAVRQVIIDEIGPPPSGIVNEYVVITTTGSKINIPEEKYLLIYDYIKNNKHINNSNSSNIIKQKLTNKLDNDIRQNVE